MLARAHKKFYRIQHPEIYLLDLKVQYEHKIKLSLDMISKYVFLYLCLPDYKDWNSDNIDKGKVLIKLKLKQTLGYN